MEVLTVIREWQKGDKFAKIEECYSTDINGPVLIVSANAFDPHMPIEWRKQVPLSDEQ